MLQFERLSYWEKTAITEGIDFLIIGAGIVGSATALALREKHPSSRIIILERGYVPTGASTKNAGFACFGSVTEIADDLSRIPEDQVWATVDMRWRGLQRLKERFDPKVISLEFRGSWDLITPDETSQLPELKEKIGYFNEELSRITGHSDCFSYDQAIGQHCGFSGITGGFHNRLEGELHTGKLMMETHRLLAANNILTLHGIEVFSLESTADGVEVHTNYGVLHSAKVGVTVNGFAQQLLGDQRVQPARAQVLVTSPIPGFSLPGCFHYQHGYYYFRSIENRLLLGGGRNLDFAGETTTELEPNELIQERLRKLVSETILPGKNIEIDYQWAGIMGVGKEKKPLIELIQPNVAIGVRMGGMGVAIGSLVGEELAGLLD